MRSVKVFALGIVGLAAAFLLPAFQSYLLFMMAISPLILLVLGQFWLPRSKRTIQVWFSPIIFEMDGELISAEPGTPPGRLSGKDMAYSFFKQWHEFEIITHRHWLLSAVGFSSLVAAWVAWSIKDSLFAGIGYFYVVGSIWAFVISLAIRW